MFPDAGTNIFARHRHATARITNVLIAYSHYLTPSLSEIPSSFRVHIWYGKTRMAGLQIQSGNGRSMISSVVCSGTIRQRDRHTDSRPNALCRAAKTECPTNMLTCQRPPACCRPWFAAAPAFGVNTRSRCSSVAAVHCWRPSLSRGRGASVEQSARFRHGVNFAAHVQAMPEDCTVREKLLNTGCFRRLERLPSHVIFCV